MEKYLTILPLLALFILFSGCNSLESKVSNNPDVCDRYGDARLTDARICIEHSCSDSFKFSPSLILSLIHI